MIESITLQNFNQIDNKSLKSDISLVYMNIRSLRKHFNEFILNIKHIINQIKIIVLVKTNIIDAENSFYYIKQFNAIFKSRDGNGGGIEVYVRENIHINEQTTFSVNFESTIITLSLNKSFYFPFIAPQA